MGFQLWLFKMFEMVKFHPMQLSMYSMQLIGEEARMTLCRVDKLDAETAS